MKKFLMLLAVLVSVQCFSQVSIPPGGSVIVTAQSCPICPICPKTIHDTVYLPVPPVIVDTPPPPPVMNGYNITYSNSFNAGTKLDQNQLGRGSISTTVVKPGNTGSFKAEVKVGDAAISSGFRSEQQYTGAAQNPVEGAVEYDVLYESWQTTQWGGSSIQWHPQGGGSAFLFLETAQGTFNTYQFKQGYKNTSVKIIPNKWYHMRWEFKWSTKSDGYARYYRDGALAWEYSGITQGDGGQPYLKLGLNFFTSEQNQTISYRGGVVYFCNLNVLKKN